MKKEIYEKLKASKSVTKLNEGEFIYLLVNADGQRKPKLYSFLFNSDHKKPLLNEITDEDILNQIAEGL